MFQKLDPEMYYEANASELDLIGQPQTRARWRSEGKGPEYMKAGGRVIYSGKDVLDWLEARRVKT